MTYTTASRLNFNNPPKLEVGKHYRVSAYKKDGTEVYATNLQLTWRNADDTAVYTSNSITFEKGFDATEAMANASCLSMYSNIADTFYVQLEEGTTATDYEPYIPSVKMLAEENAQQSADLKNLPQKIQMKGAEWTGTLESLGNDVYVCINGGNATDKPSGASLYGYYRSTYLNGGAKYCEFLDFANKKMYSKMWIGSVNNGTGWIELTK